MKARLRMVTTLAGIAVGIGAAAEVLHGRDTHYPAPEPTARLLYLRSGRVADRLMLSFDALAADIYWIRTIQHYGRDAGFAKVGTMREPADTPERRAHRFELLWPLLDLTTTLDPHFNIAYRFGAIFLAQPKGEGDGGEGAGAGRPDEAIALLEKGLKSNPARWEYAYDAGFVHNTYTGNFAEAARWFEIAVAIPGAPSYIGPIAADVTARGGNRTGAREMASRMVKESEEKYIRNAAARLLKQLDVLDQIDQLQAAVNAFNAAQHHYPFGWQELTGGRPIPRDPAGTPYEYDRDTHRVSLSKKSPLSPLPEALIGKQDPPQAPK